MLKLKLFRYFKRSSPKKTTVFGFEGQLNISVIGIVESVVATWSGQVSVNPLHVGIENRGLVRPEL